MFEHFVSAQHPVYAQVLAELAAGHKRTHWMWFIFPQLRALGHSEMARRYGLLDLAEARGYLAHPLLGPRLDECTALMLTHRDRSANAILHAPDDLKFRSSMTLFARAAPEPGRFAAALAQFFDGVEDPLTLGLLQDASTSSA